MPGISDQSVFAYNVRGPLGKTNVNKDIVDSIRNKAIHKNFPLFHNGITIVANKIDSSDDSIVIDTFFVVNGCQSLTALYNNKKYLTTDLKVLTKFIQVSVDSNLASTITNYSNNQNGVKLRDFKSNHTIQVRLQNEFSKLYGNEYFYEVKRGEISNDLPVISNETVGIYLTAFDIKKPWNTPKRYLLFDEMFNELFGRPEVDAHRVVMLQTIDDVISSKMSDIQNQLIAKYSLTKYAIMYMVRLILEADDTGKVVLVDPGNFVLNPSNREKFKYSIGLLVNDIIIDFNHEVVSLEEGFDYRAKLRDDVWVKKVSQEIVGSYLKSVKRGRIDSFHDSWISISN